MKLKAYDQCHNCGKDFADHNYVEGDLYQCPYPSQESGYGYFHGGDPRNFHPDGECCSPDEIANHRKACQLWDEAEAKGKTPEPEECPSGWIFDEHGKPIAHVLRSPYGIGIYTYEMEQYFELHEPHEKRDYDDLII
jgi:hypothetical protein